MMEKVVGGIPGRFEFLEHMSDVYVRAYGRALLSCLRILGWHCLKL